MRASWPTRRITFTDFFQRRIPVPERHAQRRGLAELDKAAFTLYRSLPNREDRKKVFAAFFGKLGEFHATFGTQLYAEVKKDMFYRNARHYNSCVEAALDGSNIPVAVYTSLVNNVSNNLGTFHRYLRLRARMMGIDTLHYYDLYAPAGKHVEADYTYEEAEKLVLASLKPLGEDYIAVARKGFADRVVKCDPSEGKRSGAYSQGAAYDVHPYMLLTITASTTT